MGRTRRFMYKSDMRRSRGLPYAGHPGLAHVDHGAGAYSEPNAGHSEALSATGGDAAVNAYAPTRAALQRAAESIG